MVFRYSQVIGELMFALVTFRPGVLYPTALISQYKTSCAKYHCATVKRVHRYLRSTSSDGLCFWKPKSKSKVPTTHLPTLHKGTHVINMPDSSYFEHVSFADACWADNLNTIRSVSRTAMFLTGAPVNYKCKFQPAAPLRYTKSELYAPCEVAKNSNT